MRRLLNFILQTTPFKHFETSLVIFISIPFFVFFFGFVYPADNRAQIADQTQPPMLAEYRFFPLDMNAKTVFASDKNQGYFSNTEGEIISVDLQTNRKSWQSDLGGESVKTLYVQGKAAYAVIRKGTEWRLIALDQTSGLTRWQTKIEFQTSFGTDTEDDTKDENDNVYLYEFEGRLFVTNDSGDILVFSVIDGISVSKQKLNAELSTVPVFHSGHVYFGTKDRRIIKVSLATLSTTENRTITSLRAAPQIIIFERESGRLIVGDDKGSLMFIDKRGKTRTVGFRAGAAITSIEMTENGILVSSLDNFLYLFSGNGNRLIWKRRLAGRIEAAPLVSGKQLFVTTVEAAHGSIIDLQNGRVIRKIFLPEKDFFTGGSLRAGDYFILTTSKGFISFSL